MTSIALDIARAHPAYAGHFPSHPILPGAVLLERSLAAVARQFAIDRSEDGDWRIAMAKFLSPVRPGESLRVEVEAAAAPLPGSRSFTASVFAGDRLTMTAVLVLEPPTV